VVSVQKERQVLDLRKYLLSGWILVTGNLDCMEKFEKEYYSDAGAKEDIICTLLIIDYGRGVRAVVPAYLAKKREELREFLGEELDRVLRINFKYENDRCIADLETAGRLTRRLVIYKILGDLRKEYRHLAQPLEL
jgi:hypothetical protein